MLPVLPIVAGLGVVAGATLGAASVRFYQGSRRADREYVAVRFPRLRDVGTVQKLSVLPLIDWYTDRDGLVGEAGLSYLIRADDKTILLDVGLNRHREHPSPLLRNLAALDISLSDIDMLVLSHDHADHTGGRMGKIDLSAGPVDFPDVPAYVPSPVKTPTTHSIVVDKPMRLATGVISTGAISNQDFVLGRTLEQSLAFNVEGKGAVIVIGCGHPRIDRIMERVEMVLDEPIYGVIGGLHYPVTASRFVLGKVQMQKIVGTGKWLWDPVGPKDVEKGIGAIESRNPKLVALSGHDSCDWSLDAFRKAFPDANQEVRVGREIVLQ